MKKLFALLLFMSFLFTGCAIVSTNMQHPDGRRLECRASGFGWIGAPAALIMRHECVNNLKAQGFVEEN